MDGSDKQMISENPLIQSYYDYLLDSVHAGPYGEMYNRRNLIERLWSITYFASNPDDENRKKSGFEERYHFAFVTGLDYHEIDANALGSIDSCPVRVLEVMIALCHCIESLMTNWEEDRTYVWFWRMLSSLGIYEYDDFSWDKYAENNPVDDAISAWMDGRYMPNGEKGLFTIYDPYYDCREHSLWEQMQLWVKENMPIYNPDGIINL